MQIIGTLGELLARAAALPENEDDEPLQLFVQDLPLITASTPAVLCNESGPSEYRVLAYDRYRYVLMLHQLQAVLGRWRESRGRQADEDEACYAVMHYSEHDDDLPDPLLDAARPFSWRVGKWRGEAT